MTQPRNPLYFFYTLLHSQYATIMDEEKWKRISVKNVVLLSLFMNLEGIIKKVHINLGICGCVRHVLMLNIFSGKPIQKSIQISSKHQETGNKKIQKNMLLWPLNIVNVILKRSLRKIGSIMQLGKDVLKDSHVKNVGQQKEFMLIMFHISRRIGTMLNGSVLYVINSNTRLSESRKVFYVTR